MKSLSEHVRNEKTDVMLNILSKYESYSSTLKKVSKIFDNELESQIFDRYDLFNMVETLIYELRMNQ